jgi:uncharacterized protein (TIGR02284 family)
MAQDRPDYPNASSEEQHKGPESSVSIVDRAGETVGDAWKTTRATGSRALESGQRYGERVMREPLSAGSIAVFVIGASAGLALAYILFRSASSADDRSRTSEVIGVLNGLIQISQDGERGFGACAEGVTDDDLKRTFRERAERCRQAAVELQLKVEMLGGYSASHGTTSGALHRAWVNVKSSITGMDEIAVLSECERGEDVARNAYAAALSARLPPTVRAIVERQYRGVIRNHDLVRELRDRRMHPAA